MLVHSQSNQTKRTQLVELSKAITGTKIDNEFIINGEIDSHNNEYFNQQAQDRNLDVLSKQQFQQNNSAAQVFIPSQIYCEQYINKLDQTKPIKMKTSLSPKLTSQNSAERVMYNESSAKKMASYVQKRADLALSHFQSEKGEKHKKAKQRSERIAATRKEFSQADRRKAAFNEKLNQNGSDYDNYNQLDHDQDKKLLKSSPQKRHLDLYQNFNRQCIKHPIDIVESEVQKRIAKQQIRKEQQNLSVSLEMSDVCSQCDCKKFEDGVNEYKGKRAKSFEVRHVPLSKMSTQFKQSEGKRRGPNFKQDYDEECEGYDLRKDGNSMYYCQCKERNDMHPSNKHQRIQFVDRIIKQNIRKKSQIKKQQAEALEKQRLEKAQKQDRLKQESDLQRQINQRKTQQYQQKHPNKQGAKYSWWIDQTKLKPIEQKQQQHQQKEPKQKSQKHAKIEEAFPEYGQINAKDLKAYKTHCILCERSYTKPGGDSKLANVTAKEVPCPKKHIFCLDCLSKRYRNQILKCPKCLEQFQPSNIPPEQWPIADLPHLRVKFDPLKQEKLHEKDVIDTRFKGKLGEREIVARKKLKEEKKQKAAERRMIQKRLLQLNTKSKIIRETCDKVAFVQPTIIEQPELQQQQGNVQLEDQNAQDDIQKSVEIVPSKKVKIKKVKEFDINQQSVQSNRQLPQSKKSTKLTPSIQIQSAEKKSKGKKQERKLSASSIMSNVSDVSEVDLSKKKNINEIHFMQGNQQSQKIVNSINLQPNERRMDIQQVVPSVIKQKKEDQSKSQQTQQQIVQNDQMKYNQNFLQPEQLSKLDAFNMKLADNIKLTYNNTNDLDQKGTEEKVRKKVAILTEQPHIINRQKQMPEFMDNDDFMESLFDDAQINNPPKNIFLDEQQPFNSMQNMNNQQRQSPLQNQQQFQLKHHENMKDEIRRELSSARKKKKERELQVHQEIEKERQTHVIDEVLRNKQQLNDLTAKGLKRDHSNQFNDLHLNKLDQIMKQGNQLNLESKRQAQIERQFLTNLPSDLQNDRRLEDVDKPLYYNRYNKKSDMNQIYDYFQEDYDSDQENNRFVSNYQFTHQVSDVLKEKGIQDQRDKFNLLGENDLLFDIKESNFEQENQVRNFDGNNVNSYLTKVQGQYPPLEYFPPKQYLPIKDKMQRQQSASLLQDVRKNKRKKKSGRTVEQKSRYQQEKQFDEPEDALVVNMLRSMVSKNKYSQQGNRLIKALLKEDEPGINKQFRKYDFNQVQNFANIHQSQKSNLQEILQKQKKEQNYMADEQKQIQKNLSANNNQNSWKQVKNSQEKIIESCIIDQDQFENDPLTKLLNLSCDQIEKMEHLSL